MAPDLKKASPQGNRIRFAAGQWRAGDAMRSATICWILISLLSLIAAPALGQPKLPLISDLSKEEEQAPVPHPDRLEARWWNYLEEAEGDELSSRIEALIANVESAALSLKVSESGPAVDQVERIRNSLLAYQRLRGQPPLDPSPPVRLEGEFTPEELFSIVAEILGLERSIDTEAEELAERETALARERAGWEADFARYLTLPQGSTERLTLGLEVIAERASAAVTEARLLRLRERTEQLRSHRADLEQQLEIARNNVVPESVDPEALSAAIEAAAEQAAEAGNDITVSETRLLEVEETTPAGRVEAALRRQELVGALVARARARLKEAMNRAQLAWLDMRTTEEAPSELDDRIADWRELGASVNASADGWRTSATGVLLTPPSVPETSRDQELVRVQERARNQAQTNLKDISELNAQVAQLNFLLDLIARDLGTRQGTLQRWWIRVRLVVTGLYDNAVGLLNTRIFPVGDTPVTTAGILRVIIILLIAFWISRAIRHALDRLGHTRAFMSVSSIYTLGRLIHYLIMISALLIGLGSMGLDFGNLALIAGALSVGIGFGLQSIVSNFVSGLILLFERSLKVGDYVELDSGLTGHVREINIRSTRINTNDNIDVLVPNSEFVSTKLTNWTLRESIARMRVPFGVAYGTDKELVRKAALEAAEEVEFTLTNMPGKEAEVWLVKFGDSSLDFELLVWVSRQGVRRPTRVRAYYLWALHSAFERYGIQIPFPQRDLHVRTGLERLSRPADAAPAAAGPGGEVPDDAGNGDK